MPTRAIQWLRASGLVRSRGQPVPRRGDGFGAARLESRRGVALYRPREPRPPVLPAGLAREAPEDDTERRLCEIRVALYRPREPRARVQPAGRAGDGDADDAVSDAGFRLAQE